MAETQFCPPNKHEYNTPTDPKHDRLHDRSCMLDGGLSHALADNGSGGGEVAAAQPATEGFGPRGSVEHIPKEEPMQRSNVQSAKNNKQD